MTSWPVSCVLIGNGSLLQRCGDHLVGAGARLTQVVTEDEATQAWAARLGVPCAPFDDVDPATIGAGAIDAVFSIANLRMLPEAWRRVARQWVVNFHDGPLPAYRGLHVTTWAILAGERRHGITWHVATAAVDGGDVLAAASIDVAPDETAFTLNAKCYDAGLHAFIDLIGRWQQGTLVPQPQPAIPGQYFGRRRRPEAAGYVDLSRGLGACEALVRALDFGPYDNPLGTPWVWQGGAVVPVTQATLEAWRSGAPPSSDPLPAERAAAIGARHSAWCVTEPEWQARLRRLEAIDLPSPGDAAATARETVRLELADLQAEGATRLGAMLLLWLTRTFDVNVADVGCRTAALDGELAGLEPWFEALPPLRVEVNPRQSVAQATSAIDAALTVHGSRGSYLRDLPRRYRLPGAPADASSMHGIGVAVTIGAPAATAADRGVALRIDVAADAGSVVFDAAGSVFAREALDALAQRAARWIREAVAAPTAAVAEIFGLDSAERARLLTEWNATALPIDQPTTVAAQFVAQASRTPDALAVRTWTESMTYRALDDRATRLAHVLAARGVGHGDIVGLHLPRSADLLVAVLAVLKVGAAYLPIDPDYPAERIAFMISDSGTRLVVTASRLAHLLPTPGPEHLVLDAVADTIDRAPATDVARSLASSDLAYLIYTSGSTGRPKGVMLEHGNVTSFFAAMDQVIEAPASGVWLAVTSLSFDISVLELLWTLCRGLTVVVHDETRGVSSGAGGRAIDLSLFYFASDDPGSGGRYRLLLEGARFADTHGFEAVWTPERHFHEFGGLYPNPAVTSAAIAAITTRVGIRAGSLVLPLHHPIRAAEDWAVVDNLSNGRVGIAFASGWHPDDFVLAPGNFKAAKQVLFENLATMRRLWRGDSVSVPGPTGSLVEVRTLPRPVQPELPFWITTAGNPETFRQAGEVGASVLTHLLGQTVEDVAAKIAVYREARRAAGHAGPGHVTLMLHTFVGESDDAVREIVRAPMKRYLGTSLSLVKQHAWSFPAFKGRPVAPEAGTDDLFRGLSPADMDALLEHAFDRYFDTGGLFGSVESCVAMIDRLRGLGVDEVACLIDFGVPVDATLAALEPLAEVRRRVAGPRHEVQGHTVAESLAHFGVTHLQCTPSMASLVLDDPASATPVAGLRHWLVGGEALPFNLAARMRAATRGRLTNMYGPTETTIWSLTHDVIEGETPVPIGRPIANTRLYVLDSGGTPVPTGAAGELFIGGPGVARGYHERPELTAERFVADPFGPPGSRLYRTGDRVRYRADGVVEFLGRIDQQVKLRGHRIELGEIEAALRRVPGVRDAAVAVHEHGPEDMRLLGFVTAPGTGPEFATECRAAVRAWLPDVMVPSAVVCLDRLPLTPNGKVDRRQLPVSSTVAPRLARRAEAPVDDLQRFILESWKLVLRTDEVGIDDNFFDLGGHSLLTVQVASRLTERLGRPVPIADLFRFPTIRKIASHLGGPSAEAPTALSGARTGQERAAARRGVLQRRAAHTR